MQVERTTVDFTPGIQQQPSEDYSYQNDITEEEVGMV